jgi:hypothetical protein
MSLIISLGPCQYNFDGQVCVSRATTIKSVALPVLGGKRETLPVCPLCAEKLQEDEETLKKLFGEHDE